MASSNQPRILLIWKLSLFLHLRRPTISILYAPLFGDSAELMACGDVRDSRRALPYDIVKFPGQKPIIMAV
jgi:hypothetical protein